MEDQTSLQAKERDRSGGAFGTLGGALVLKSSLGKASIRTDLVDGRNDESQGDLASVAAIPDTERKRPSVPADGFSLMEKWKSPLHHLSEGAWRFSCPKNWGTSSEGKCRITIVILWKFDTARVWYTVGNSIGKERT